MRDFRDAKAMAISLRQALSDKSVTLTHSESLELIAKSFGLDNWNILAAKIEADRPAALATAQPAAKQTLYCSFCGKTQHDVATLIAGPSVFICNQCVDLCDGILLDKKLERDLAGARARLPDATALEVAAEALRGFPDSQLEATLKSCADWLEHIEWSLAQAASALAGEPRTPWRPDARAVERGWAHRDPLQGKSREEIAALQAELQGRQGEVRERVRLLEGILAERRALA